MKPDKPIKRVELTAIVSGGCTNADGFALLNTLETHFKNGFKVQLSLSDAPALTSSFLNSSFGEIIENYGLDFLRENLTLVNYKPSQAKYIKEYVENSAHLTH